MDERISMHSNRPHWRATSQPLLFSHTHNLTAHKSPQRLHPLKFGVMCDQRVTPSMAINARCRSSCERTCMHKTASMAGRDRDNKLA